MSNIEILVFIAVSCLVVVLFWISHMALEASRKRNENIMPEYWKGEVGRRFYPRDSKNDQGNK